jgi:hypothetical protein
VCVVLPVASRGDYHGPTAKYYSTTYRYIHYLTTIVIYYQLCTSGYQVEEDTGGDTWRERGETTRRRRREKQKLLSWESVCKFTGRK